VRERSRVEVELHVLLLSPLHPACKLIYGYLVTVNLLATELTINLMKVETESTSQERVHLLDVLTEFVDVASLSRIVTCALDTTRSSLAALEANHIVSLPAVQRDWSLLQSLNSLVCIYTQSSIALLSNLIIL
jgi:hypothetical protein